MGLEAKKLLPAKFRNYPLYQDVIIPLLQRYLDLSQEEFKTIGNKYKNFLEVPDKAILEIISELGYDYILDGISLNSEDKNIIYGYLKLVHLLKGSKKGLRFAIEILGYDFDEFEWYENAESIAYTRNQLMEGPADLQVDPYVYKVALNMLLEEFETDRIKKFSKFSKFYVYDILSLFLNLSFDLASLSINFSGFMDQNYSNDSGVIGTNYLNFGGFLDQNFVSETPIVDPPECLEVVEIGYDYFELEWNLCNHNKIFYVKYDDSLEKMMVYYFRESSTGITETKLTSNTTHDEKNIKVSSSGNVAVMEIDFYDNGNNQIFICDLSTGDLTQITSDSATLYTTAAIIPAGDIICYSKNYEGLFLRYWVSAPATEIIVAYYDGYDFQDYTDTVDYMEFRKIGSGLILRKGNELFWYNFLDATISYFSNPAWHGLDTWWNFDTTDGSPGTLKVVYNPDTVQYGAPYYSLHHSLDEYSGYIDIAASSIANIGTFKPVIFGDMSLYDNGINLVALVDRLFLQGASGLVYYVTNNGTENVITTLGTIPGLLYFCDKYVVGA